MGNHRSSSKKDIKCRKNAYRSRARPRLQLLRVRRLRLDRRDAPRGGGFELVDREAQEEFAFFGGDFLPVELLERVRGQEDLVPVLGVLGERIAGDLSVGTKGARAYDHAK